MTRKRVLIVDDDQVVRESLIDELGEIYTVAAAESGEQAVQMLESDRYDAVVSDLRMPGIDGISVLDCARQQDPEVVRILLTGYLDERARLATIEKDAPFKVGKPWHDSLDVTLRRAFEHRDVKRQLSGSALHALAIAGVGDELSKAEGVAQVAAIVTMRALEVDGIEDCGATLHMAGSERLLAGIEPDPDTHTQWRVRENITADGAVQLHAGGVGEPAREIVKFLAQQAVRWSSEDRATLLARRAATDSNARSRLQDVSRRATLGAMTASIVHELASLVTCLQAAVYDIDASRAQLSHLPDVIGGIEDLNYVTGRIHDLFGAMRAFVRSDAAVNRQCRLDELIQSALALCTCYTRASAIVRTPEIEPVLVDVNEPLFLQVIVNLLRNAADASPRGGTIDIEVHVDDLAFEIAVVDDGPGVDPDQERYLFEPFCTTKPVDLGSGLGLAISAEIVNSHGGDIRYERAPGRGARFVVRLPRS